LTRHSSSSTPGAAVNTDLSKLTCQRFLSEVGEVVVLDMGRTSAAFAISPVLMGWWVTSCSARQRAVGWSGQDLAASELRVEQSIPAGTASEAELAAAVGGSLIDEIVREGARRMLAAPSSGVVRVGGPDPPGNSRRSSHSCTASSPWLAVADVLDRAVAASSPQPPIAAT
jgi:hypothetical protein